MMAERAAQAIGYARGFVSELGSSLVQEPLAGRIARNSAMLRLPPIKPAEQAARRPIQAKAGGP